MADVLTSCLKFTKPDVGGSDDTWGSKLNTDWDIMDRVYRDFAGELVSTSGTGAAHDVVLVHTGYADIDDTNGRRFAIRSGFTNTGTMTLNVGDGNGARPVNKFVDGAQVALAAGDFPIHYVGDFIYIRRSGFSGWILTNPATGVVKTPLQATTTVVGVTRYATDLEAQNATLATVAVTPKNLASVGGTVLPTATDTVYGKVKLATLAEALNNNNIPAAINPYGLFNTLTYWRDNGLSSLYATTTAAGKVEFATNAETIAGSDPSRAVSPLALQAALDDHAPNAGSSQRGIIAIATDAEALVGSVNNEAITPASLDYVFDERVGTTTKRGSTAFATGAESIAGAIADKAVQPMGLQTALDAARSALLDSERLMEVVDARVNAVLKQYALIPE